MVIICGPKSTEDELFFPLNNLFDFTYYDFTYYEDEVGKKKGGPNHLLSIFFAK